MLNRINYHRKQIDDSLIKKLLNHIYFVRTDNYKLISYGNKIYELFDILNDPNEMVNLIKIKSKIYEELKLILQTFLKNIKDKEKITKLVDINEKNLIKKAVKNITF